MVFEYSYGDIERKVGKFKQRLYSDGFYRDQVICRVATSSGASGYFDRGATFTYTAKLVSGIAEYGPQLVTNHNVIETIQGDVRLTVRLADKMTVISATEIWLGCTLSGTVVASGGYSGATKYRIKNSKPDMFNQDHIFVLVVDGVQS